MADAALPTPSLMRRFLESLRSFEASAQGDPPGPPADRVPLLPAPVYARLTAHDASGYSWVQSVPKTDGTWSDLAHGLASASSGKAFEIGGRTDVAADTIVRLESRQTSDGLPIWVFGGGGAAIRFGKPTGAFSSGATLTLDPCDVAGADSGEANETVYVQSSKASYSMHNSTTLATGTVVPFAQAADGYWYVVGMPKVVLTAFQVVTASQLLQMKTRDDWGTFCGTESDWVTVHTGDVCA